MEDWFYFCLIINKQLRNFEKDRKNRELHDQVVDVDRGVRGLAGKATSSSSLPCRSAARAAGRGSPTMGISLLWGKLPVRAMQRKFNEHGLIMVSIFGFITRRLLLQA